MRMLSPPPVRPFFAGFLLFVPPSAFSAAASRHFFRPAAAFRYFHAAAIPPTAEAPYAWRRFDTRFLFFAEPVCARRFSDVRTDFEVMKQRFDIRFCADKSRHFLLFEHMMLFRLSRHADAAMLFSLRYDFDIFISLAIY